MGVVERADQPQVILPKGGNPDWTIQQGHERYSEAEHRTWTTLYERQAETLPSRACEAFFRGLEALDLHEVTCKTSPASTGTLSNSDFWKPRAACEFTVLALCRRERNRFLPLPPLHPTAWGSASKG